MWTCSAVSPLSGKVLEKEEGLLLITVNIELKSTMEDWQEPLSLCVAPIHVLSTISLLVSVSNIPLYSKFPFYLPSHHFPFRYNSVHLNLVCVEN